MGKLQTLITHDKSLVEKWVIHYYVDGVLIKQTTHKTGAIALRVERNAMYADWHRRKE
jgi:hypothetical protein